MSWKRAILYVVVGLIIGALLLALAMVGWQWLTQSSNGCRNANTHSVEDAQVFLMGTIGGDYSDPNRDCWREHVVEPMLDELGVTYYNPVVENWTSENAEEEARAIANAETIVLVITANHPSIGSLAESGWAVISAQERDQQIVIYIADYSDHEYSQRAREIVLSQAQPLAKKLDRVYLVPRIDDVVQTLRDLYR